MRKITMTFVCDGCGVEEPLEVEVILGQFNQIMLDDDAARPPAWGTVLESERYEYNRKRDAIACHKCKAF